MSKELSLNGSSSGGNWSTVKKILIGVATVLITALVSQVLLNTNRITAVEVEIRAIKAGLDTNRTENRDEHKVIIGKIDSLSMIMLRKENEK